MRILLINIFSLVSCPELAHLGHLLVRCIAVATTSIHRQAGASHANAMLLAHSMSVLFLLSATPFWWGVYAWVSCFSILSCSQYSRDYVDWYSPPLSLRNDWILWPVWVSTIFLNTLNFLSILDLAFRKYVHVFLLKIIGEGYKVFEIYEWLTRHRSTEIRMYTMIWSCS